jgi:hypothetical protein
VLQISGAGALPASPGARDGAADAAVGTARTAATIAMNTARGIRTMHGIYRLQQAASGTTLPTLRKRGPLNPIPQSTTSDTRAAPAAQLAERAAGAWRVTAGLWDEAPGLR